MKPLKQESKHLRRKFDAAMEILGFIMNLKIDHDIDAPDYIVEAGKQAAKYIEWYLGADNPTPTMCPDIKFNWGVPELDAIKEIVAKADKSGSCCNQVCNPDHVNVTIG